MQDEADYPFDYRVPKYVGRPAGILRRSQCRSALHAGTGLLTALTGGGYRSTGTLTMSITVSQQNLY
jgi:hypothetical protein